MGELGAFLKIERVGIPYEDPTGRIEGDAQLQGVRRPAPGRGDGRPGRALHGVRRPVLPQRLPAGQPDPGLERPRLQGPLVRRDPPAARHQQLPGVHRPPVPRAVRGGLRAGDPRGRRGHDQADRELDHQPRLGRGLGRSRSRPSARPAAASPSSAPARRAWPPRSSCAGQATRVVLFERDEAAGGLVRFGVPDFKIEKWLVERRVDQLRAEGVEVRCGVDVGVDITAGELREQFDAVVLATGSRVPRDLQVPGRELDGVHFAMDYLYERTRQVAAAGGAPGVDHRRGQARRRHRRRRHRRRLRRQLDPRGRAERHAARAAARAAADAARRPHAVAAVAPEVPPLLRDGGGQGRRQGRAGLLGHHDRPARGGRRRQGAADRRGRSRTPPFAPVEGTERELQADLVLLAMGFLHPEPELLEGARRRPRTRAATPRPRSTRRRCRACSPRATAAAASR